MSDASQVRINELARELEVKAKAIIDLLPGFGVTEKKTHSSSITVEVAEKVRHHLKGVADAEAAAEADREAKEAAAKAAQTKAPDNGARAAATGSASRACSGEASGSRSSSACGDARNSCARSHCCGAGSCSPCSSETCSNSACCAAAKHRCAGCKASRTTAAIGSAQRTSCGKTCCASCCLRLPLLLQLHRLQRNSRGPQRLLPRRNTRLHVLRQAVLRRVDVRNNLDNSLKLRGLLLLLNHCVPVRPARNNRGRHLDAPCPQVIVGLFPEQFPVADAPVVRVPASPCARNNPAKGRVDVPLRLVPPEVPVAQAEQALLIVLGDKGPVRSRPVRVPALVHPAVLRCCRRFPTKCRRRRSPASRCIRASRHNASVPQQISARWKVSASFTRRVSVPVQVGAVPRSPRLLRQSHARRAISL